MQASLLEAAEDEGQEGEEQEEDDADALWLEATTLVKHKHSHSTFDPSSWLCSESSKEETSGEAAPMQPAQHITAGTPSLRAREK
jgi:hypothetical protein